MFTRFEAVDEANPCVVVIDTSKAKEVFKALGFVWEPSGQIRDVAIIKDLARKAEKLLFKVEGVQDVWHVLQCCIGAYKQYVPFEWHTEEAK